MGFGSRSNVEPFLGLAGIFEELCKFWILELAAMLSPFLILRIFEKIWFDLTAIFEFKPSSRISIDYELAAMSSPSSSSYLFRDVSLFFGIALEPCQNFAIIFFSKILSF